MTASRTKNSVRNIIFSMLAYGLQIILGFLARRYFIYFFSTEYLGLNSLFSNVLSLLSLAELGFGTAIVFAMYKPMAEGDEEKVRQLMQFYKKSYFTIGCVILGIGLCVLPFMDYFKKQAPNVNINLYIVYGIFLFNSVVSYFFAHRRSLLYTNQRNDIESKINMLLNILLTGGQLVAICFAKNYYLYIALIGIFNILNNVLIFVITQKMFPQFLKKPNAFLDKESKKAINKNIMSMIFHKIGSVVVYSTDSLIIFLVLGSVSLGKYSNYLMITTYVSAIVTIFTNAMRGSVGNSIASESVEKNQTLLKKLNFIYCWIVAFCTIAIFILSDPFIDIVLTKDVSTVLTFDKTIILLICVSFYLNQSRNMVLLFKEGAGLFYQDRFKSIFESVINLVTSIILAKFIGLAGVIIGTIISTISTCLWVEPYVLNKHYLKQSTLKYFAKYLYYTFAMLVAGGVTYLVCNFIPHYNIGWLIVKFAVCAVVPNIVLLITYCWLPEFKQTIQWGKQIISGFKQKKKN